MMELDAGLTAEAETLLRGLGWIGEDERVLSLEPAGEGNMNVTLRARLPERSIILKQARPYVARYPDIPAPVTRLQAEAAFYHAIAASDPLCRHTPAVLGEDPANHLLCLQDLGEGSDLTRLYSGTAAVTELSQTVSTLATWLSGLHHLATDGLTVPTNDAMRALNHAHIFEIPFGRDSGVTLSPALAQRRADLAADDAVRRQAGRLGRIYLGAEAGDSTPILLHGDYYPGSWLELADGSVAVIDPEFCFVGAAEFDVGVLTAHLIMAGCEEQAAARLLRAYHPPEGFSPELARQFAAIEVIRRLLGVAQLPLSADDVTRNTWLSWAHEALVT